MEGMGFNEFLAWLIAGGSAMAASWLLERIPAFQALEPAIKKFVAYGLAAVLGTGAVAVQMFAPDIIVLVEPYFKILSAIFISIFLSNAFHKLDKVG